MRSFHSNAGRWTGPLLALLGLSGSLLVFRDGFERLARPQGRAKVESRGRAPRRLDEVARAVLASYAGAKLLAYQIPDTADAPHEALILDAGGRALLVVADPYEARPLGLLRGDRRIWLDPVARLHFHWAAAALAVPLLFLIASGLFLRRGRRDLHTRLGLMAALPLAMWAATGLLFHAARPGASPPPRASAPGPPASLDALAAAAGRALPSGRLSYLQMPAAPGGTVTARVRLPGEWRQTGENDVHLDPATAGVLRVDRGTEAGWRRWRLRLAALHFGEFAGLFSRLLWSALGLAPLALWLTGLRRQR